MFISSRHSSFIGCKCCLLSPPIVSSIHSLVMVPFVEQKSFDVMEFINFCPFWFGVVRNLPPPLGWQDTVLHFIFIYFFIYLFIFGRTGSFLLEVGFSSCSKQGLLSCWNLQALELRLSSCGMQAELLHVGSSQTRDQTRVPCIGRQILNH